MVVVSGMGEMKCVMEVGGKGTTRGAGKVVDWHCARFGCGLGGAIYELWRVIEVVFLRG